MRRPVDPDQRCTACRMLRGLCICALVPKIETRTRLVLVMHQLEAHKTTNTGMLAARCLPNSEIVMRGRDDTSARAGVDSGVAVRREDADLPWLDPSMPSVLLFPHEDARPIEELRGLGPLRLIVPDGTWGQAKRARRRLPGLDRVPCAIVPGGAGSYRLRQAPKEGHVSTLEAIARALGILEGPHVQAALERVFTIMVERTLWSRGSLRADEVTGGVPET